MEDLVYVDGAVIGHWVTTKPEYVTHQPIGTSMPWKIMSRAGRRDFIQRHFDAWMRERTDRAHAAYMAQHGCGGIEYAR